MADYFSSKKEKLTFQQLVLKHLDKILDLSAIEFYGGYYRTVAHGDMVTQEYVPSTKKSYCQAVEHFAFCLIPHFDEEMEKMFDEFQEEKENIVNEIIGERVDRIKKEFAFDVKKAKAKGRNPPEMIDLEEDLRKARKTGGVEDQLITNKRLELCEYLFQEICRLLKRLDYLKSAVYSESDLEEDEEDTIIDTDKDEESD